jgi:hypothetical protein
MKTYVLIEVGKEKDGLEFTEDFKNLCSKYGIKDPVFCDTKEDLINSVSEQKEYKGENFEQVDDISKFM